MLKILWYKVYNLNEYIFQRLTTYWTRLSYISLKNPQNFWKIGREMILSEQFEEFHEIFEFLHIFTYFETNWSLILNDMYFCSRVDETIFQGGVHVKCWVTPAIYNPLAPPPSDKSISKKGECFLTTFTWTSFLNP